MSRLRKHPWLIQYSALWVFWVSLMCCTPSHASQTLPIIRIDAQGLTPLQLGLNLGRAHKLQFPSIEQQYDQHLASLLNRAQFNALKTRLLPTLLAQLDTRYLEEMRGVASAWETTQDSAPGDGQLSLTELQVLNLLPDLGFAPNGSGLGAFAQASAGGYTLVGRTLDWDSSAALRQLQAITVYQYADTHLVNIGFAGLSSVLTGFNEQGLFLALFNAAPYTPYVVSTASLQHPRASAFDVRTSLSDYQNVSAASYFLRGRHYGFGSNILMADKLSVHVLEHPAGRDAQIRRWDSSLYASRIWNHPQQVAVVDCYLLSTLINNCHDASDVIRWQRLDELSNLAANEVVTARSLSTHLLDTKHRGFEIFNAQTLQSLVYQPERNELYLYTAPVDSSNKTAASMQLYTDLAPTHARQDQGRLWKIGLLWFFLITLIVSTLWFIHRARGQQANS